MGVGVHFTVGVGLVVDVWYGGGMDKHDVCSLALQRVGEAELQEGSPTYKPCMAWYRHVLALACARYDWTFLAREVCLMVPRPHGRRGQRLYGHEGRGCHYAPEADVVLARPEGCLKVLFVCDGEGRRLKDWRLTMDGIVVPRREVRGGAEVRVRYQSDMSVVEGCLPDGEPDFCEAVICMLASRVAMKLTSNMQLAMGMEQEAERYFNRAILRDRQQDYSNAIDPLRRIMNQNIMRTERRFW